MDIELFFQKINESKISYVHWKSNTNIDKALNGIDDLDILVSRKDKLKALDLFNELNIFRGLSIKDSWQKEIFHFYGLDSKNNKLIHIHIHFALELGYDFDKCFDLPIVDEYLENSVKYKNVFIPQVEKEYSLLLIRIILKHSLTSFLLSPKRLIKVVFFQKKGFIEKNILLEFNDLKSRINRDKFEELLDNEFNFINKKLIYRFEKLILNNNNIYKIFIKSFDLKIQIREYSNNNLFKSFVVSFLRIANLKLSILFNKKINKKLKEGKAFAFVGGDGAGKSTNIETIHNFFKSQIAVTTIHVGRPRFTTTSYLLIFLSKFFKFFKFFDLRNSMIFLAIAISRKAELSRGFKLKEKGEIVLFDRVPIKGITSMDCPKMHLIKNTKLTLFKNFEMYIYNNIYIMTSELDKLFVL